MAIFSSRTRLAVVIVLLATVPVGVALAAEFEEPPRLPAQVLAPASLLSGSGFHVDNEVPTDGLLAHYTIQSDVGVFQANSTEMLEIRIAEIPAIQELTKTSKTKVFAQALATNAARPIAAAGQMVMNPVETIKGFPAGVGRFFGRVGLAGQRLSEAATEPEEASAGEKAGEFAKRTGQTTRDVFGYEQERRELAKRLHVDPYTTNPVLSKQLDDFALTAFRAHVSVTTTMAVFIPGSMAITATRVVSQWVWETPRADLIVQDEKALEELKVPEARIRTFMRNPVFPLSVQTAFVENLKRLAGLPGCVGAVDLASTAESEEQARFMTDAVGMLARYHETQTPLTRLMVRRGIIGQDRTGAIVVQAPVDYVSWTKDMSYFANRPDFHGHPKIVSLTGQFSPLARKNFQTLGWVINEKVSPIPLTQNGPQ